MIKSSSKVIFDEIALLALLPATESMYFKSQLKSDSTLVEEIKQFLYKGPNTHN